jgi:uncharacterized RDD family membrane protein YckC
MKKEVASFTRRILAYIIDVLIINTLILKPFNLFSRTGFNLQISRETIIIGFSTAMLTLLYWALLEFTVRQSIGKIITRIYVSSLKKQLTLYQCIMRNITKIVTPILIIDVLYALINKTHQRYFEKISNTEVLQVPKK